MLVRVLAVVVVAGGCLLVSCWCVAGVLAGVIVLAVVVVAGGVLAGVLAGLAGGVTDMVCDTCEELAPQS